VPERQIEVYETPMPGERQYAARTVYGAGSNVGLDVGAPDSLAIAVDWLFA